MAAMLAGRHSLLAPKTLQVSVLPTFHPSIARAPEARGFDTGCFDMVNFRILTLLPIVPSSKAHGHGHAVVVGLKRSPKKVTKSMSKDKIRSRCRVTPFIKVVNFNHFMPTRYNFDLEVRGIVTSETLSDAAKRKEACLALSKKLEEKYLLGQNKWFFQKLRF